MKDGIQTFPKSEACDATDDHLGEKPDCPERVGEILEGALSAPRWSRTSVNPSVLRIDQKYPHLCVPLKAGYSVDRQAELD